MPSPQCRWKIVVVIALALTLAAGARPRKQNEDTNTDSPPKVEWAPLPKDGHIQRYQERIDSPTGIAILKKEGYFGVSKGFEQEDWVDTYRFLILNEDGVKNATLDIRAFGFETITHVLGRTVGPDGSVTPLNPDKDVRLIDVRRFDEGEKLFSVAATISFPRPEVGAILDLHVVSESLPMIIFSRGRLQLGAPLFLVKDFSFPGMPVLENEYRIKLAGGFPGVPWRILSLGSIENRIKVKRMDSFEYKVTTGPIEPSPYEPHQPPTWYDPRMILCYMDLEALRGTQKFSGSSYNVTTSKDPRGLISQFEWGGKDLEAAWVDHLQQQAKSRARFLKKPGRTFKKADVAALAPSGLDVSERARRLYRFVQETMEHAEEREYRTYLYESVKHGMYRNREGTFALSYLLRRAHIPYFVAVVPDRYFIPFSPLRWQDYLNNMEMFLIVPTEEEPLFLAPGVPGLPFDTLPPSYQGSWAICLGEGDALTKRETPIHPSEKALTTVRFEATMDTAGRVEGSCSITKEGLAALSWFRDRSRHPTQKETLEILENEISFPGTRVEVVDRKVAEASRVDSRVRFDCTVRCDGLLSRVSGMHLLEVNPLCAGYHHPFSGVLRETPIWYDLAERVLIEGTLHLPPGARVEEAPEGAHFTGPEDTTLFQEISVEEGGDHPVIRIRFGYEIPLVLGRGHYDGWRQYQKQMEEACNAQCLIRLAGSGS